jgi:hypothetical protein
MASLEAGDVVLVTKLDRLGRSTRELLDLIERISSVQQRRRGIPIARRPALGHVQFAGAAAVSAVGGDCGV